MEPHACHTGITSRALPPADAWCRFEWNFQRLVQIHAVANSREWLTHLEHGRDSRSALTAYHSDCSKQPCTLRTLAQ